MMHATSMVSVSDRLKQKNKKSDKRWLAINALLVMCFTITVITIGVFTGMQTVTDTAKFAENVKIDGIELGGLSFEDGQQLVLEAQNERLTNIKVPIVYNGQEGIFGANELGISTDAEAKLRQAYTYNKQGKSIFDNFEKSYETIDLETEITVDNEKLQNSIMEFLRQNYEEPEVQEGSQAITYTDDMHVFAADLQEVMRQVLMRVYNSDNSAVEV